MRMIESGSSIAIKLRFTRIIVFVSSLSCLCFRLFSDVSTESSAYFNRRQFAAMRRIKPADNENLYVIINIPRFRLSGCVLVQVAMVIQMDEISVVVEQIIKKIIRNNLIDFNRFRPLTWRYLATAIKGGIHDAQAVNITNDSMILP